MPDSRAVRQLLTNNTLRKLLKSAAASGSMTITSAQRQAIREICASIAPEAREKPEQLLIDFKAAVNEAAYDADVLPGPERNELIAQVVSVFIEELYRGAAEKKTSPDGDRRVLTRSFFPSRNSA